MGIATYLKVPPNTVYGWNFRNKLPKPDGFVSDRPYWYPSTIDAWTPPARKVVKQ